MKKADNTYISILKRHKLKVTQPRLQVLEIIDKKDSAISQPELEKLLGEQIDRVTLYRSLGIFQEKGILHKIFDLNGTATYALCSTDCNELHHHDNHVHFICSKCNNIYCLDNIPFPSFQIPAGFQIESLSINAIGICSTCQTH
jgi:Fur family ferric uptake transcriptional regulator